jgi:hypothetical protein
MKLTLFGATGRTGTYVLEQALAAGHEVTALVRNPEYIEFESPELTILKGNVRNPDDVYKTVAGADAVISTTGPTRRGPKDIMSIFSKNLIEAMNAQGVKRLIMTTGGGIFAPEDRPKPINRLMIFLLKILSRKVFQDSIRGVENIRATDLGWTIVRVPKLLDKPYDGNYKAGFVGDGMSGEVSRGNFADFVLKQLEDDTYLHKMPVLSDLV